MNPNDPRHWLWQQLQTYQASDNAQANQCTQMLAFIETHPDCFERHCLPGHITGSAWLLNSDHTAVLLTHHKKLGKWLQLGGHSDGDPNTLNVALREAQEESGIDAITPLSDAIFDIDIHEIPAFGEEPAHLHYDVRFMLQAACENVTLSDESHALRWVRPDEAKQLTLDASVRRMFSILNTIQTKV
ncbi:MAG: NUDIX hydrolase [marine bacterium B5-7]|nr:MAG: NUDIX hydrolase [marine bacterium B5-7]